jgi:hypothetical protein
MTAQADDATLLALDRHPQSMLEPTFSRLAEKEIVN